MVGYDTGDNPFSLWLGMRAAWPQGHSAQALQWLLLRQHVQRSINLGPSGLYQAVRQDKTSMRTERR